jgi:hypothetical protein
VLRVKSRVCGFVTVGTKMRPAGAPRLLATIEPWPDPEVPMDNVDSNARWERLTALRDEIDGPAVVVPICVSRLDGKPHDLSPRARGFAEALSFSDAWSRITEARNRRLAA